LERGVLIDPRVGEIGVGEIVRRLAFDGALPAQAILAMNTLASGVSVQGEKLSLSRASPDRLVLHPGRPVEASRRPSVPCGSCKAWACRAIRSAYQNWPAENIVRVKWQEKVAHGPGVVRVLLPSRRSLDGEGELIPEAFLSDPSVRLPVKYHHSVRKSG